MTRGMKGEGEKEGGRERGREREGEREGGRETHLSFSLMRCMVE